MVIGVAGKAGSGKDTFAEVGKKEFFAQQRAFAGPVKQEVAEFLTRCEVCWEYRHLFGTQHDKEARLRIRTSEVVRECEGSFPELDGFIDAAESITSTWIHFTPRALMQWWGTEYRRAQDPDYWIKRTLRDLDKDSLYIISDVRFVNEARGILQYHGGFLINIERPDCVSITNMSHASENELNDWYQWDYIIENTGTLEGFKDSCRVAIEDMIRGK